MAQQITRWICHKEGGKKEKDNWERGESRVIVPKSGSVALCPCFRNHFQPKRGIHGSLQGQDGLGANWSSQRYEKGSGWKKMVLRSVPTHPIPWSSKSEYSFCFTNASSARPPISPAPLGWEHPGLAEAWPELVEVVFVLPSQDIIYKHHSYPQFINFTAILTSRLGPKIGVCLAQGSCDSLEFLSISWLLPPAGSPSLPGAWCYFWILWFISNLSPVCFFYFPSPSQLSQAGLEQLCKSPPGLQGEGGTFLPDLNPGIISTSSRPLPTPVLLKLLISETETTPFTFQNHYLKH